MLLNEIIRMAFASLGVNKLRSGLTMAGITIGVFSVVGVMTAVSALRGSIESGLSFLGSNMFQFAKYPLINNEGNNRRKFDLRRNITLPEAMRYKRLMEDVSDIVCLKAAYRNGVVQATYQNRKTEPGLSFLGTNEHFTESNQFTVELGRNLTSEDVDFARPVVVIGQVVVQKLFPAETPLGKQIAIGGHAYRVVGVFESKGNSFGQTQDDIAIIPITRFMSEFGGDQMTVNIATQAPSQVRYNETLDKAITVMRVVRQLKPEDDNDFEVYSNDSLIAWFAKIADAVRAGALVISGIALLAASVGIMNIMLVSVTERTKEIGVRKSIGARKVSILTQFLIEAVVLSLFGCLVGIGLGVIGGDLVARFIFKAEVVFPWDWATIGLVVCTGIGIAAGLYPAMKAANLDPIEALRYE
ncbi:MAG TPA: ABC transporter permease [Lacunisphaera sp.]|nr:ABC transporter permease [Lacunisphaera sp.]